MSNDILAIVQEAKTKVKSSRMDMYKMTHKVIQEELEILQNMEKYEILQSYLKNAVAHCNEIGFSQNKGLWILNQNDKLSKEGDGSYMAAGLELYSGLKSGNAVCLRAIELGLSCLKNCIVYSGNGRFQNVLNKRGDRTDLLFQNPVFFMALMIHDLEKMKLEALMYGKKLAIRLNVFSDLHWEDLAPFLFNLYPEVQFYDYTKEPERFLSKDLPENYHMTASYHEKLPWDVVEKLVDKGINVAAVFNAKKDRMPYRHADLPVVNGDEHDFRFLDPKGVIVGLARKGKLSKDNHKGFMLQPNKAFQPKAKGKKK